MQGFGDFPKSFTNHLKQLHSPKNLLISRLSLGCGYSLLTYTFSSGFIATSSEDMTSRRKLSCSRNKTHFLAFTCKWTLLNLVNTSFRVKSWSSRFLPIIIVSSKYTRYIFYVTPPSTSFISHSKVAGALTNPKGITLNWQGTFQKCVFFSVFYIQIYLPIIILSWKSFRI